MKSSTTTPAPSAKPLTDAQIAAGAAIKCDHGKPIGRNAAIEVWDAMQPVAAVPAAQAAISNPELWALAAKHGIRMRDEEGARAFAAALQQRQAPAQAETDPHMQELAHADKSPVRINNAELAAFHRFCDCCEDFDSGGHDVEKSMMLRLAQIGVVRSTGFGRYETTKFGDWLRDYAQQAEAAPVASTDKALCAIDALDSMGYTYAEDAGWLPPAAAPVASAEPIYYVERAQLEWLNRQRSNTASVQLWKGKAPIDAVPVGVVAHTAPAPTAEPVPGMELVEAVNAVQMVRRYPNMDFIERNRLLDLAIDRLATVSASPSPHPVSIRAGQPSQQEMLEAARLAGMDVVGDCINPERTVGNMTRAVFAFGKRIMDARAAHPSPEGGAAEAKKAAAATQQEKSK